MGNSQRKQMYDKGRRCHYVSLHGDSLKAEKPHLYQLFFAHRLLIADLYVWTTLL